MNNIKFIWTDETDGKAVILAVDAGAESAVQSNWDRWEIIGRRMQSGCTERDDLQDVEHLQGWNVEHSPHTA